MCACESGFYGEDCSMGSNDFTIRREMRETLTEGLRNASLLLDVSNANLAAVASLLLSLTQVGDEISETCMYTALDVVTTQSVNVSQATETYPAITLMHGLSNTIAVEGLYTFSSLASTSIRQALDNIGYALTSMMVSGQDEITVLSDNIRSSVLHPYLIDIANATFSVPQTLQEKQLAAGVPTITLPSSGLAACGLAGYSVGTVTSAYGKLPYNLTSTSGILRQSLVSTVEGDIQANADGVANYTLVLQNQPKVSK
jgi:hypothetical protein